MTVLDELPFSLEDSICKMKGKDYDFLDHRDVHFDEDFAEVVKVSEGIQVRPHSSSFLRISN